MELDYAFMTDTLVLLLKAVPVTLKITVVTLLLATPFAFLLALARLRDMPCMAKFVIWETGIVSLPQVIFSLSMVTVPSERTSSVCFTTVERMPWGEEYCTLFWASSAILFF